MSTQAQFTTTAVSGSDLHWRVPSNTQATLIMSASQEDRVHGSIFNDANGTLFLKFGGSAGIATSGALGLYDVKLTSASYFELPKPIWQGEVWGAWDLDQAGGWARVLQVGKPK